MDRRGLFKSFSSILKKEDKTSSFIRPPYVSDFSLFEELCPSCETPCSNICEENIIKIAEDKTPYLDFSISGCTYCEECFEACEILTNREQKIVTKIEIDLTKCLGWNSVMCFSCKDACFDNAIDFQGLFNPQINEKCTNCGFCIRVCPTQAVILR